jgi:hypothetical protein
MKSSMFWVTVTRKLHAGYLLGLRFKPVDGGDMFFWNVGSLSPDYTGSPGGLWEPQTLYSFPLSVGFFSLVQNKRRDNTAPWFIVYFPYLKKIKGGLWDHSALCLFIRVCPPVCVYPLIFVRRFWYHPAARAHAHVGASSPQSFRFVRGPCCIKGNSVISSSQIFLRAVVRVFSRLFILIYLYTASVV